MLLLQRDQTFQAFVTIVLLSALTIREVVCNYIWPLTNGFPVGSRAVIRGIPRTDSTPQNFYINLLPQSPSGDGDIDFHLAARFGDGVIVLNNFILGKNWQQEIYRRDSPIQAGKPFEITILAEQSHLSIYINDSHYEVYPYRKPRERIKYLQVTGGVSVSLISVDMNLVYSWPFVNGFSSNQKITIHGTPTTLNFDREFSINFQNCPTYGTECYIAFRMLIQYGKGVIVNNSYQKGAGWGQPEVYQNSPITSDRPFIISITKDSNQFKISINEQHFCTFTLRHQHSDITHLAIKGIVDVTSISTS